MPAMQYGLSSYERAWGNLVELPVINMLAEKSQSEEEGVVLQSRPGLEALPFSMGPGPVRQLFQRDLVLAGQLFGVSGSQLYRNGVSVGSIDGNGPVSMAGYQNLLFINAGSRIWGFDGATLSPVPFPDGSLVSKILIAGSRLVAIQRDTGKFYWSDVLSSTISGLSFATAENQPDRLLDMVFLDGVLRLMGAETIENWASSPDPDLPFQPLQTSVIERGIRATGCVATLGSTYAWVTNQNQICIDNENNIISNPGLQYRISQSRDVSLFTFLWDGIEYLCLRLDDETQVYNPQMGVGSEFVSYGYSNWLPRCFAGGVFGSAVDGRLMQWGEYSDFGGVLERRFRAGFPVNGGGVNVSNVRLQANTGHTPYREGQYADPIVEMRISDDGGNLWEPWEADGLGAAGDYRKLPEWRALGLASQPGFLCEFRVTGPVPFRVSGVYINEPYGGR